MDEDYNDEFHQQFVQSLYGRIGIKEKRKNIRKKQNRINRSFKY